MKKIFNHDFYEYLTLIIALILFICLSIYISFEEELNVVDLTIRDSMYNFRGQKYGFWYFTFRLITELGFFYIVVTVACLVGIRTRFDRRFWFLCGTTIITYLANELIKIFFLRERPIPELQWMIEHSTSYPSGHSMVSTVFYGLIIYFIYKSNYLKINIKRIVIVSIILIILLIGLSRMVLGVHYFTDVIGGYLCGLIFLETFVIIYKKIMKKAPIESLSKNDMIK